MAKLKDRALGIALLCISLGGMLLYAYMIDRSKCHRGALQLTKCKNCRSYHY